MEWFDILIFSSLLVIVVLAALDIAYNRQGGPEDGLQWTVEFLAQPTRELLLPRAAVLVLMLALLGVHEWAYGVFVGWKALLGTALCFLATLLGGNAIYVGIPHVKANPQDPVYWRVTRMSLITMAIAHGYWLYVLFQPPVFGMIGTFISAAIYGFVVSIIYSNACAAIMYNKLNRH